MTQRHTEKEALAKLKLKKSVFRDYAKRAGVFGAPSYSEEQLEKVNAAIDRQMAKEDFINNWPEFETEQDAQPYLDDLDAELKKYPELERAR
jgi:tripartite-type tricarboxylate transporter receptor subunit TctC